MPKLPALKPKELVSVLLEAGFVKKRQTGSHVIMFNQAKGKMVVVPIHAKSIGKGLLHAIIKQAGLNTEKNK